MRILLFDLSPYRVGGDKVWNYHVKIGLENLGHEVDVVYSRVPSNIQEAVSYRTTDQLRGYEMVIFSDAAADLSATKIDLDGLITTLKTRGVITVAGLHGNLNQHPDRTQRQIISALQRVDIPWVTSIGMLDDPVVSVHLRRRVREMTMLPYAPQIMPLWPPIDEISWRRRIGFLMTGRISTAKGQRIMTRLADRLNAPLTIAGKAQFKSASQLVEDLVERGGRLVSRERAGWSSPWTAETAGGNIVRYTGEYRKINEIPWDLATVHVNLTSYGCSIGHLEYTSLEAIDAGLRPAVPMHVDDHYNTVRRIPTRGYNDLRSFNRALDDQVERVVDTLNRIVELPPITVDHAASDLLKHDTATYVQNLFDL